MDNIYINNKDILPSRIIETKRSFDKYLQQSPKIKNNKYRPLSGKPKAFTFLDNNIYNNNYIVKGTNFPKQMKRLNTEDLVKIIGPSNKKAGNVNKNKKKILKTYLGEQKIKIKTDVYNDDSKKNDIKDKNKIKKLKIETNESNLINSDIKNNYFNANVQTRKVKDKFLPKGYLQYEHYLLNKKNTNKEKIYNIKEIKQKSNESDIFFFRPKTEKESQKTINKDKAKNYNIKLGSDIFNSKKELNNLMKSSELYLFKRNKNPFSTESNSYWASKVSAPTYMNYPSVEYNILNPGKKCNTKTKERIYKESLDKHLMNPIYKQKSISTFYDITKVGMNRNLTYNKLYEENKKIFFKNDDVCTSQYDNYKNYQGIIPKPFYTQVNKNVYT